jgi:hypothetical protein
LLLTNKLIVYGLTQFFLSVVFPNTSYIPVDSTCVPSRGVQSPLSGTFALTNALLPAGAHAAKPSNDTNTKGGTERMLTLPRD